MASAAKPQSKVDEVYSLVKERILDKTYGPGYRIVVSDLVRENGYSPIPWREALRRLEAEGWVNIIPNAGARVATFDINEHHQQIQLIARLDALATVLAAPHITAADIKKLRGFDDEMHTILQTMDLDNPTPENSKDFNRLNRGFHEAIYKRCDDPHLVELLDNELDRLNLINLNRRFIYFRPGRQKSSIDEHEHLIELFEKKAPKEEIEEYEKQHKLHALPPDKR
ncbi:MAG: GntR family transcriptional regulator [Bifidobacteriaceae bacterium]|jgi:DNA-binding GntR family transcriptional regulator|nr:GntR family transcriptional regulator [Bifidobacteriaceae bacterium]